MYTEMRAQVWNTERPDTAIDTGWIPIPSPDMTLENRAENMREAWQNVSVETYVNDAEITANTDVLSASIRYR